MTDAPNHIKGFVERYRVAKNANSKEMRLSIAEAEQLVSALGVLLAGESQLKTRLIELQDRLLSTEIAQDGGGF